MRKIYLSCLFICLAFFIFYFSVVTSYKNLEEEKVANASSGFTKCITMNGTFSNKQYFYSDTVYKAISNVTMSYGASVSGTVVLYIPKNITVTVTVSVGEAGISLHYGKRLIVVGEGSLKATGGNAGSGGNGDSGYNGYLSISDNKYRGGTGGDGGRGGEGGG